MHKAVLILLLIAVASPVWAEWSKIFHEVDGKTHYIDLSTIRKNGQFVKVWELADLKEMILGISSAAFLKEYDCKEERERILSSNPFSGKMGSGDRVLLPRLPNEWKPNEWQYILPGREITSSLVCHEWLKIIGNERGSIYLDTPFRRNGQLVTIWSLLNNKEKQFVDGVGYFSVRRKAEYDCKELKRRVILDVYHSESMAFGNMLFVFGGDNEWEFFTGKNQSYAFDVAILPIICN